MTTRDSVGQDYGELPRRHAYPSRLMLGRDRDRPIYVVVADNLHDKETTGITVYQPDPMRRDASFARRQP